MRSESVSRQGLGTTWERTRAAVPTSTLWSALIVLLMVLVISKSTVSASWVSYGIETAPMIALAGAALMALLAVTPLPWWLCVGAAMLLGPIVAGADSAQAFRIYHPADPSGIAFVQTWLQRVQAASAFEDADFVLFVIAWLMWVTGAWLAWCVLRWRQPLIGLIPGATALATNVLNYPDNQNGYTFEFLVLTFAMLLWTNYTGSIAKAVAARVKLTGDAKWDFWESGLVATAILIVAGILLPPLSTGDRTATMESSVFSSWAQLQQALNHQDSSSLSGTGNGTGTTGFSTDIVLGAGLQKSNRTIFTYTVSNQWVGPKYFRGVNATEMVDGRWRYNPIPEAKETLGRSTPPDYVETYQGETYATFTVNMQVPPPGNADILFYPGELVKVDRTTTANEAIAPVPIAAVQPIFTVDRLSARNPASSKGTYNITTETPNAFADELRTAGTAYPDWLQPYMTAPTTSYRPTGVLNMELSLAQEITAGKSTVFDQAMAIRDFLYNNYKYNLTPGAVPPGQDGMDYFLNTSHQGYCVYFATAMGDMLRLLGIPTRLVNGFGPGGYDSVRNRWVVIGSDAHTWVEVYFPGYGWIPFDPTPDPNHTPIQYGVSTGTTCVSDNVCDNPTTPTGGLLPSPTPREIGRGAGNAGVSGGTPGGGSGFRLGVPDAGTLTKILAVLLAVMLLVAAWVSRYLRPRTVMGVWQRTLVLARLAGAALVPGETPLEFGRRLARAFPEADASVRSLAGGFAVAAYAPRDTAEATRTAVMEAWAQLRPLMLRRVATRLRPGRA